MDFLRIIKQDLTGDLTTLEPTIRQHVMHNRLFHQQYAADQIERQKSTSKMKKRHGRRKSSNYRPVPKVLFPSAIDRHNHDRGSGDVGKATLRKIKKQGEQIDAVYEQQDRVYYELGKSKNKARELQRGMWYTVCWAPLVDFVKAKWLHRKNKKTQKEQHRRHDQTRRSKEQVRSGIDVMRRVAEEMNADLKHQNERTNRINEKAQRNVEKLRSVNSLLNKDL